MRTVLIYICSVVVFCFSCLGNLYAHSDQTLEFFQAMMGDRGSQQWHKLTKEMMWTEHSVLVNAQQAIDQYERSIQYLNHPPIHTIPKTIHFIWIGPKPFPEKSIANLLSWTNHHPTWKIFFWTDMEDRKPPVEGMEKRLLSNSDFGLCQHLVEASTSWIEKADLLRYSIIYTEGGVYADHDVECIRPFDPLVEHYDFVAGYAPLHPFAYSLNSPFIPNNGLIVARPHHPILEKTLFRLRSRWHSFDDTLLGKNKNKSISRVLYRTFDPFAYCVTRFINADEYRNIILPTCYFHSATCFKKESLQEFIEQERVYAIHHFDATWISKHSAPSSTRYSQKM